MSDERFDEDYFLRGPQTGKSLYEDYKWLPNLTKKMARCIVDRLGIAAWHTVLDFGCARGYMVRVLRELGIEAVGMDVSQWAIDNCDPKVKKFVMLGDNISDIVQPKLDWIIAKDVLEHVPRVADTIGDLLDTARLGVFAVVPLSAVDGEPYVVPEYEKDVTHIHRLTLGTWVGLFARPGWRVECCYRISGIKDNYAKYERGNGFITARRIKG